MFIATSFTITKIQKQPKGPSGDEWIKQLWDIYTTEYYSTIKKMKILLCAIVWVGLENIMLNKPVRERQIPYDFTHVWNLMNKLN